ncbi:MAG: hypothetical protein H0X39_19285 [Actinobacteria bacterium]|nr:hypothetical protein [Actinomycetota bacterium]
MPRSEGGSHDASNLILACDGHHKAHHEGKLRIAGRAPNITVQFTADPTIPHVETSISRGATHATERHAQAAASSGVSLPPHHRSIRSTRAARADHSSCAALDKPHQDDRATCRNKASSRTRARNGGPARVPLRAEIQRSACVRITAVLTRSCTAWRRSSSSARARHRYNGREIFLIIDNGPCYWLDDEVLAPCESPPARVASVAA